MSLCIITNPGSGTSHRLSEIEAAVRDAGAVVREAPGEGDAAHAAEAAAREGFQTVVAAGGDGTVNEVVNGLMRLPPEARPIFGILPLGTGNDLARSLALPTDLAEAFRLVHAQPVVQPFDVFCAGQDGKARYAINVAAGGFSGAVNEVMTSELKQAWGPVAYLVGAIKALPNLAPFHVRLTLDGGTPIEADVYNIFVCNARYVAGGKLVAPDAIPDDGLLDVVVVKAGTPAEMAALVGLFALGRHHESAFVETHRACRVEVQSEPGLLFNVDGELLSDTPALFTTERAALRVVTGTEYVPNPAALAAVM